MAIENTDLLIIQRPATEVHYKMKIADLPTGVPNGTAAGQYLAWNGTSWQPTETIDGGEYAT